MDQTSTISISGTGVVTLDSDAAAITLAVVTNDENPSAAAEKNAQIMVDVQNAVSVLGIKKDAIDLSFNNNYLTISAKRDDTVEDNKENFIRQERRYGEFKRSFYIDNVDEKNINASFEEGVLKIELPKLEKGKGNSNKIEIH